MTKPISFGSLEFNLSSTMTRSDGEVDSDTPFRILVMGDFSGRAKKGGQIPAVALPQRRLHRLDRDNLDEVMAKMGVELRLPLMGPAAPPVTVSFSELDDFHPDRLYERLDAFRTIRENSKKSADSGRGVTAVRPLPRRAMDETVVLVAGEGTGSLLDQILGEAEGVLPASSAATPSQWDRFLSDIVRPHLVPDDDGEKSQRNCSLDEVTGDLMRAILHCQDFQELEALWRGVSFLISRLDTGEELQVFLLDVTKGELAADLCGVSDSHGSGLHTLLVEKTVRSPGAAPWALLAGLFTFDAGREDVALLARLSQVAASAGAPFIGGADEKIVGCDSLAANPDPRQWQTGTDSAALTWMALRRLSTTAYLGLALPRFLLRLPYGAATDPIDSFEFEESSVPPAHEEYLWGNPALAVVSLLGQSFSEQGWEMIPGTIQDLVNLPLHLYKEQGESAATPCAETLLTYDAADLLMEWGLMPLASMKDRDMARLACFSSLADPPCGLAGRWRSN